VALQMKGPQGSSFISSSNGWYIGRTLLVNLEQVPTELVADALIHEAIHVLLYMVDEVNPWQPSLEMSTALGNTIVSPWTLNKLSIRNLVQAVFVWFGLFNFWQKALAFEKYDQEFCRNRLQFIYNGFERLQVNETLPAEYCKPELIQLIKNIRQGILDAELCTKET
jgi:hypothetical protein